MRAIEEYFTNRQLINKPSLRHIPALPKYGVMDMKIHVIPSIVDLEGELRSQRMALLSKALVKSRKRKLTYDNTGEGL